MEVIDKTELQDVYRIKDGVLLFVNKYRLIIPLERCEAERIRSYCKCRQSELRMLDGNVCNTFGFRVEPVGLDKYEFQLKTTGKECSGNFDEFSKLILEVVNIIESYRLGSTNSHIEKQEEVENKFYK